MTRASEVLGKKPYQPPKLIVYGDLTQLTQSKLSGGAPDNGIKSSRRT